MPAPLHPDEAARIERLHSYGILDTSRDHRFDRVVFLTAQIMKVPIATITFVDTDRQWFKAHVGVPVRETTRDIAFCAHTILQAEPLVIEDAREDPRFTKNPFVAGAPFVRFYAGVPLYSYDGLPLGSLCAIDRQPRRVTPEQIRNLKMLAREVEELLEPFESRLRAAE